MLFYILYTHLICYIKIKRTIHEIDMKNHIVLITCHIILKI